MKKTLTALFIFATYFINAQNVTINCRFILAYEDTCNMRIDKFHIKELEPSYKA